MISRTDAVTPRTFLAVALGLPAMIVRRLLQIPTALVNVMEHLGTSH